MAGKKASNPLTRYAGLQVQTSAMGLNIPVGWGTFRCKCNLVDYLDFKSKPDKASSGKGGSVATGYSYSATIVLALCEGPIDAIDAVYVDSNVYVQLGDKSALQQASLSLATGAIGQPVWSYLTSNHPSHAIGYSGLALAYAPNYPLDSSATPPNHSFEVARTSSFGVPGTMDADPSLIVTDFFTNTRYGVPSWGPGLLGSLTQYQDYCLAAGLLVSPVIDAQRSASDFLTELLKATNSTCVWSEGVLKFIPYGDTALTGHGKTYTPDNTPVYSLNDDDYIVKSPGDAPLLVDIMDQSDAYNVVQLEYLDRSNQYNMAIALASDAANVAQYGMRRKDPDTVHVICDPNIAQVSAQLWLQRTLYIRAQYKFTLSWAFALLEPGDILELTDSGLGLNAYPVRIIQIDEDETGQYDITAEDFPIGVANAPLYDMQVGNGTTTNQAVDPGGVEANLLLWSGDQTNSVWSTTNASVAGAVADDQFSLLTACAIVPSTATGGHYISQGASTFAAVPYTFSVCLQKNAHNRAQVQLSDFIASAVYIDVDLNAGTVIDSGSFGTDAELISAVMEPTLTSGIWQVVITGLWNTSTTLHGVVLASDNSGNTTWTGDGSHAINVSQAALRQGVAAGDYAQTRGAIAGPFVFNPPASLASGPQSEACAAVAGGPFWGGCNVWTSIDGTNYEEIGTITAPARFGYLTASYPAGSDPDTADTLSVDLGACGGELLSASTTSADASGSLCLVDNELIAFSTADLTNPNRYNLIGYARRGVMGTAIASHASGAPFVRMDDAVFNFPYIATQAGRQIYVKFQSFNLWGRSLQDLADVNAYLITLDPQGSASGAAAAANRICFSAFEHGANDGWSTIDSSGVTITSTTTFAIGEIEQRQVAATAAAAGDYFGSQSIAFPVTGGERLAVTALVGVSSGYTGALDINWYDNTNTFIAQSSSISGSIAPCGYNTPQQGFANAPPNAVSAVLILAAEATAAGSGSCSLARPMVCSASAEQTTFAAFVLGPAAEYGADITGNWTAAAILGQAPAATDTTIAPGATRNIMTYSGTSPASPENGDVWVDTGVTPNIAYMRVAGVWVPASSYVTNTNQITDGAGLGDTAIWTGVSGTPANLTVLIGTEPIQNAILQTSLTTGSVVPATSSSITGQGALATQSMVNQGQVAVGATPSSPVHVGLQLSAPGAGQTTTIAATNIVCVDTSFNAVNTGAVSLTPSLSASGVDGLDTGSAAANTWYYVYAINDGSATHGLYSLSAAAPTLPSGYRYAARVGAVRTDGSVNVMAFNQYGHNAQYVNTGSGLPSMANGVTSGTPARTPNTAVSVSDFVPPTAAAIEIILCAFGPDGAAVAPNANYGASNSATNPPPFIAGWSAGATSEFGVQTGVMTLESSNIYWFGTNGSCSVFCLGWVDTF